MEYFFLGVQQLEWLGNVDSEVNLNGDEKSITLLEPRRKKSTDRKKWWHINRKLFRFKLHFFLLGGVVSTSASFVFIMYALLDCFQSATDPVSRNRCTKRVIVDAFGAVSPGYFC
ncbi:hypothetical protein TNCV_4957331 [Trichonephila clavipes]|nr:hypothetical protein TNCV_4957331 [Trichonephila clavipes]